MTPFPECVTVQADREPETFPMSIHRRQLTAVIDTSAVLPYRRDPDTRNTHYLTLTHSTADRASTSWTTPGGCTGPHLPRCT